MFLFFRYVYLIPHIIGLTLLVIAPRLPKIPSHKKVTEKESKTSQELINGTARKSMWILDVAKKKKKKMTITQEIHIFYECFNIRINIMYILYIHAHIYVQYLLLRHVTGTNSMSSVWKVYLFYITWMSNHIFISMPSAYAEKLAPSCFAVLPENRRHRGWYSK